MNHETTDIVFQGLGKELSRKRRERKLTQDQIAELMRTSPNHVSRIERGISHPSLDLIVRWSTVLGLSLDALFLEESEDKQKAYDMAYNIMRLEEPDRQSLSQFIDWKLSK